MYGKDVFLFKDNLTLWDGTKVTFEIEHRYKDTGAIIMQFDDGVDSYIENFVLEDLTMFRDKINNVIAKCKDIEQNDIDFTLEELKTMKGLISVDRYKDYTNPIYKNIMNKLDNKINKQ